MNGPEHYREAERLLAYIEDGALRDGLTLGDVAEGSIAGRAQVHATLALAAATALPTVIQFMGDNAIVTHWANHTGWIRDDEIVPVEVMEADDE